MPTNKPIAAPAPPSDLGAEQSTLGAMMIEPAAIGKAAGMLASSDFYRPSHSILFDAMTAMAERNEPVDLITLQAELNSRNSLAEIGGPSYLVALLDKVPTAANVEYYAEQVSEKAAQRRLWELGHHLVKTSSGPVKDVTRLYQQVQADLERIATKKAVGASITRRLRLAERIRDMADIGPPPDELPRLWWVLIPRMIHWLSAPPGLGKSTIAFNIVTSLAEGKDLWGFGVDRPYRTLYVDLESGDLVMQTKLQKLYMGEPRVRGGVFFLDDITLPDETLELIALCRSQEIDMVVFDTAARTWRMRDENDNAEVGRTITPMLDELKRAGIATLVIDHTGKGGKGARGASAKGANVDVVLSLTLHQGEADSPNAQVALRVDKHKLLGFPTPLVLQRAGSDHFTPVDTPTDPEATPGATVRCAADMLGYLDDLDGAKHGEIIKAMTAAGHKDGTARRVVSELVKEKKITKNEDGSYSVDPFAD